MLFPVLPTFVQVVRHLAVLDGLFVVLERVSVGIQVTGWQHHVYVYVRQVYSILATS